jgi:hypothetical protein
MKTNWILEDNIFEEDFVTEMIDEICKQDMNVDIVLTNASFWNKKDFLDCYGEDECVVCYGSLQFIKQVRNKTSWIPGHFCTLENYSCTHYYPAFSDYLLAEKYIMLPFGELDRQKEFLYETLGDNDCIFIRPNRGDKIFTGTVVKKETWEKDIELLGFYDVEPYDLCIVSEPQNIEKEWRLVVADTKVITGSEYSPNEKKDVPKEVIDLGNEICSIDYKPDSVWTMDICQLQNGELKLLEIGSFSCAGLYRCDVEIIVREVSKIAEREWQDIFGMSGNID